MEDVTCCRIPVNAIRDQDDNYKMKCRYEGQVDVILIKLKANKDNVQNQKFDFVGR